MKNMSQQTAKWGGVSGLAGGILACLLTPLMSIGYYRAYGGHETPPFWMASVAPHFEFLFDLADERTVYAAFGKLFSVVYILFLPGVWALHRRQSKAASKLEKFGFGFLTLALLVSFVGVGFDYWGIRAGWTIELLGMLLLQLGATVYGAASLRLKIIPLFPALLLTAAIPLVIASFLLFKQIPSAPTLPFAVASLLTGVYIIRADKYEPS